MGLDRLKVRPGSASNDDTQDGAFFVADTCVETIPDATSDSDEVVALCIVMIFRRAFFGSSEGPMYFDTNDF